MPKSTHAKDTVSFRKEAERTAIEERTIQRRIDRSDEKSAGKNEKKDKGAMQAGARIYPMAPLPSQHLKKPGKESDLELSSDTPMKRPAQPEEIAPAFVFLAAPSCSSYITGEVLPIIGGYSGG